MREIKTEKYVIRNMSEKDFEDVKELLKENEYLGRLWSAELLPDDRLDELIRGLYINRDSSYGIIEKQTGIFCGYMSINVNEHEGELSVRMRDNVDMSEVMELFGEVLKSIAPADQKNLTIQYCFE